MKPGLDWNRLDPLIESALAEDLGAGDMTTEGIVPRDLRGHAVLLAKQAGVIAGLDVAARVFEKSDPSILFNSRCSDGSPVLPDAVLADIEGGLAGIFKAERTALNFIQRISGIATLTAGFVFLVQGTKARILDTRKTTPLWRNLEKYAVRTGGGENHRFGLFDMVLIKDNHIAAVGGDVAEAIRRSLNYLDSRNLELQVEVECQTLDQVKAAAAFPIQRILLDNMDIETMSAAVSFIHGRIETEASGGVNPGNIRQVAETGVDFISIGALTHSAPALDISLDVSA
jgi:nicotinate-nucleotide pyrophosphorylase (carboxylating)